MKPKNLVIKKIFPAFVVLTCLWGACSSSEKIKVDAPAPSYTKEQIVYSLNLLSNLLFGADTTEAILSDSAQSVMEALLKDATVQTLIGQWEVAWGPVIYFSDSACYNSNKCVVDNLLVLFQYKGAHNTTVAPDYVLATSGTNSLSKFGWFNEDFDTYKLIQWPDTTEDRADIGSFLNTFGKSGAVNTPSVSYGTYVGVKNLLTLTDSTQRIYAKLKDIFYNSSQSQELAVAGHSLGGALSPALALVLTDYQPSWNPSGQVTVTSWPTAGASPGTVAFGNYFLNSFKNNFYGKMNLLDIVPHAWQNSMLKQIPVIYNGHQLISSPGIITGLVSKVQAKIGNSYGSDSVFASLYGADNTFSIGYVDTLLSNAKADGVYACCYGNYSGSSPLKDCKMIHDVARPYYIEIEQLVGCLQPHNQCNDIGQTAQYLEQAGFQHVGAYTYWYQIQKFDSLMVYYKTKSGLKNTQVPGELYIELFNDLVNYIESLSN